MKTGTIQKGRAGRRFVRVILVLIVIIAAMIGIYEFLLHRLPAGTSIAESTLGTVEIVSEEVTFENTDSGLQLAGILFKPADLDETVENPAIVVTGPMLSVKEQAQSIYAARLAEQGYVTIVFDYSYFGESEGEPRYLELPDIKASDISSAVTYLSSLDYVDAERIGGIGICGSGSYMPYAAILDERIKVVASVVPGTTMDSFIMEPLEQVEEDRIAYENGEAEPTYINLMPRYYLDGAKYYFNSARGARDNWSNQAVSWSEIGFADFHPTQLISQLNAPYLVITGENAWSRSGAESLYNNAVSEKEFYLVEDAGHFDLYDLDPYVTEAVEQIVSFFGMVLN